MAGPYKQILKQSSRKETPVRLVGAISIDQREVAVYGSNPTNACISVHLKMKVRCDGKFVETLEGRVSVPAKANLDPVFTRGGNTHKYLWLESGTFEAT